MCSGSIVGFLCLTVRPLLFLRRAGIGQAPLGSFEKQLSEHFDDIGECRAQRWF
jgi:hypothetical protein